MKLVDLVARYLSRMDTPASPTKPPGAPLDAAMPADEPRQIAGSGAGRGLPPFVSGWPEAWREVFEERAGIIEFDGNLGRADAESRAAHWTRHLFRRSWEGRLDGDRGEAGDADD